MKQGRLRSVLTVLAAVVVLLLVWRAPELLGEAGSPGAGAGARTSDTESGTDPGTDPDSGLPWVDPAELPTEARDTLDLIEEGGPFPYSKDGAVFFNNEQNLPDHDEGYYREYTVETPGSDDRGARRIVAGSSGELYWTEDHYESFERIPR